MTSIKWLHLSDWHQKENDTHDRSKVLDALKLDIRGREHDLSSALRQIDFIVFSGDVAFSGQSKQYTAAREQLFEPLLEWTGVPRDRLLLIPGNHDVDWTKIQSLPKGLQKPFSSHEEVQTCLRNRAQRNQLLKPFAAYSAFVGSFLDADSHSAYVSFRSFDVDDLTLSVAGLNSALMSARIRDRKKHAKDYGHLVVGESQVDDALKKLNDADIRIVVIHHPFDFLQEFDRDRVEYALMQGSDFILRGHLHAPGVSWITGTLGNSVIIPAGASFSARTVGNPKYANAYNFVHFDVGKGQVSVYMRRWSDPRGVFVPDVDTCPNGVYTFEFSWAQRVRLTAKMCRRRLRNVKMAKEADDDKRIDDEKWILGSETDDYALAIEDAREDELRDAHSPIEEAIRRRVLLNEKGPTLDDLDQTIDMLESVLSR